MSLNQILGGMAIFLNKLKNLNFPIELNIGTLYYPKKFSL